MRGFRSVWRVAFVLFAFAAVSACSSKTADRAKTSGAPVANVGRIVVTIGNSIDADNRKILDDVNAVGRLQTAIQSELTKAGKFSAQSPRVLEVQITDFRLRSGVTVFMAGLLSGVDSLAVQVTARDGAQAVRQFPSGDSTSGGLAGIGSSSRFQTMADTTAERVAKTL